MKRTENSNQMTTTSERMDLQYRAKYTTLERTIRNLLYDLTILSGDVVGPSDASWQDVAGTASVNAQVLANILAEARKGNHEAGLVFPSPAECLEGSDS